MQLHELSEPLTRLRLKGLLETLESRLQQARENALSHLEFLNILLQDEIQRREANVLAQRIKRARFEEHKTFEGLKQEHYPGKIQLMIQELSIGHYLRKCEHIIIMGPTGTGKTHLAQALGHQACRLGYTTKFIRANAFFRELNAARADQTWEKTIKKYVQPSLLIIDDFGLKSLTPHQADDIYELIAERAQKGSFIFTSNRKTDAWVKLFPDPVMANAALDRLANHANHIVLEGESYRRKSRPNILERDDTEKEKVKDKI